jgi:hypothetical protein
MLLPAVGYAGSEFLKTVQTWLNAEGREPIQSNVGHHMDYHSAIEISLKYKNICKITFRGCSGSCVQIESIFGSCSNKALAKILKKN